jgi:tRNA(fMet)-specific endonuclease VapC
VNALLIDTNIYSHAMRGDTEIIKTLQQIAHIGITAISIGELLSGFKAGNKEKANRQELNQFLDSPRVTLYGINEKTAEYYCLILNQLKNDGTPIPTNDLWIAAVAFQHGMPIYTKDQHFSKIKGLLLR